jgi:IS30 family transposase
MARPRKAVDPEKVKQLAALGLSNAEVAAVLEVSPDTIERRFKQEMKAGRERRNASLRRKQFEVAMTGNATMLIWLGKQHLEQKDKLEHVVDAAVEVTDVRAKLAQRLSSTAPRSTGS